MDFATTLLFYIVALLLVVSGLKVITSRNPVASALFLVLAFFNASIIWMTLEAEFLSILLILVYVGAVMVLFLFVVMMLDVNVVFLHLDFKKSVPTAITIGTIIIVESVLVLWKNYSTTILQPVHDIPYSIRASESNTHLIGKTIYTDYIFAFEIAGILLFVAIIAAISLTLRHNSRRDSKHQKISEQVRVCANDRIRTIKITPEKLQIAILDNSELASCGENGPSEDEKAC